MGKNKIHLLLLTIGGIFLLSTSFAALSDKTNELQQLKQIINQLKTNLTSAHSTKTTLQQQLKTNETTAGSLVLALKNTTHKLSKQQKILQQLKLEKIQYQKQLLTQQKGLTVQMRDTYMLGKQTYLKMLLNHQDPDQLKRTFVYYTYLQKARIQMINALTYTLKQLQKNKKDTKRQTKNLITLKTKQQQEYLQLVASKQHRQQLLGIINKDIKTKQQKLTKLTANQKTLEKIIAQLKITQISPVFATPLNKLHKKLHWPTKGKNEYLFGKSIGHSQLKWNGDIIHAPVGENVRSIAAGKIVFAQWLQGYGLLLIIDHGHGYMSLYGRNNSLYKKVGDSVHTSTLIATVGSSGGYSDAGLYFAIRHNGKPVNPKLWCYG